ncbi:hypothetical protein JOE62_000486 [Glutamicibacter nicotianae]|nr:hypothetical protein [Glutamicibacter nicotianae]
MPEESAEPRVTLVASQIIGLIVTRYIIDFEPLASMDDEQVIELVAPAIQRYLTGNCLHWTIDMLLAEVSNSLCDE